MHLAAPRDAGRDPARRSIAIVGAGVAGLTAAYILARGHDVELFESGAYAGGHTHTVRLPRGPDAGTAVDTGFIVFNDRNYPMFTRLLDQLGVCRQPTDMSFSFHCERTGLHYAGTGFNGLFAQRRNLLSRSFHGMLFDIARFNRRARSDLAAGELEGRTLAGYVGALGLSRPFMEHYLLPMGAAIWSAPLEAVLEFPAASFLRFFENHGLLAARGQPKWWTIAGGSRSYVEAMLWRGCGTVRLNRPVRRVWRDEAGVRVVLEDGGEARFDDVVIATHANQALAMLGDPSPEEQRLLGAWRYSVNRTVLHTDASVLPPRRRAWASWNYTRERRAGQASPVSATYFMNRLQRLRTRQIYAVSLNRNAPIPDRHVVCEMTYTHPQYDFASLAVQPELPRLNGTRHTHYCGSYFGHGFHEDAVRSGVHVARSFGLNL